MEFVDQDETAAQMFMSGFIDTLGPKNLSARMASTAEEYKQIYKRGITDWSGVRPALRRRLVGTVNRAKHRLNALGYRALADMTWRFACTTGRNSENGWPHTIGDVILMPVKSLENRPDAELLRLVVHEAVHVAQRQDPLGARRVVSSMGFEPASANTRRLVLSLGEARKNPDTDGTLYERNGVVCHPVFKGHVSTLSDVAYLPHKRHKGFEWAHNPEHPYEIMAEMISDQAASA